MVISSKFIFPIPFCFPSVRVLDVVPQPVDAVFCFSQPLFCCLCFSFVNYWSVFEFIDLGWIYWWAHWRHSSSVTMFLFSRVYIWFFFTVSSSAEVPHPFMHIVRHPHFPLEPLTSESYFWRLPHLMVLASDSSVTTLVLWIALSADSGFLLLSWCVLIEYLALTRLRCRCLCWKWPHSSAWLAV